VRPALRMNSPQTLARARIFSAVPCRPAQEDRAGTAGLAAGRFTQRLTTPAEGILRVAVRGAEAGANAVLPTFRRPADTKQPEAFRISRAGSGPVRIAAPRSPPLERAARPVSGIEGEAVGREAERPE